jgi:hypothetical protein
MNNEPPPSKRMKRKTPRLDQYPLFIQFSENLANPELWIRKAKELLVAARILEAYVVRYWSKVRVSKDRRLTRLPRGKYVQGPYSLLIAYAIEDYFKALLVYKNQGSFRNRLLNDIPSYIKTHDLLQLGRDVGMTFTIVEEDLLVRLSRNSTWAARYPVPTGPTGIAAMRQFSDGKTYLTAYFGPEDVDRIHRFLDRLVKLIEGAMHYVSQNQTMVRPKTICDAG